MARQPDSETVAGVLREVADAEILPRFRALADHEVREKTGPKDLVTTADIEAERRLTAALPGLLPGSVVVGEEAAEADPALLGRLRGDAPVWLVDPVDGTRNFAAGSPDFCVMAALVRGGETCAAWILDPLGERWAAAERGGGAWMFGYAGGQTRLAVPPPAPPAEMRGALNFRFIVPAIREGLRARADAAVRSHHRLGCAGHEYLRAISGLWHFMLHGKTMPWDHVPGCLLHREAGGHQARFDGSSYRPGDLTGGLMVAPDEAGWWALHGALIGDRAGRAGGQGSPAAVSAPGMTPRK